MSGVACTHNRVQTLTLLTLNCPSSYLCTLSFFYQTCEALIARLVRLHKEFLTSEKTNSLSRRSKFATLKLTANNESEDMIKYIAITNHLSLRFSLQYMKEWVGLLGRNTCLGSINACDGFM